ncbi:MAG: YitT family protein [Prevotella sp.]|nr:YitT family protein [Prevotella sp.]
MTKKAVHKEIRDYVMIAIAMMSYCIGWTVFLLPNNITTGGVPGISSVLYWGTGIPVQFTYFAINALLLIAALKILGLRFCIKTIFAVFLLTTLTALFTRETGQLHLLDDQPFMASIIGAIFCGSGVGIGLAFNGSTGGTDIVAAIVNKYRDISLGRVIMLCDIIIISSSYLVFHDWEQVIYGYVVLLVTAFCIDQVVNSMRRSVQFFIISEKYEEIARLINNDAHRGVTVINGQGFYSGHEVKMLFVLAKKRESTAIFRLINEIDPAAFVSQSTVIGVYGNGFDKFKVRTKRYQQ